jgi:ribosomal protein S27AE
MAAKVEPKLCKKCGGVMSYSDLPGFGRVWQCARCVLALEGDDGKIFLWHAPEAPKQRQRYSEEKKKSRKACPECHKPMWEVVMPDFGSRWQCEECRLTVFATGGVQKWKKKVD